MDMTSQEAAGTGFGAWRPKPNCKRADLKPKQSPQVSMWKLQTISSSVKQNTKTWQERLNEKTYKKYLVVSNVIDC